MAEQILERLLYASRWLLAPLYLGLAILLIALSISFFKELWHLFAHVALIAESDLVLAALTLIDLVLVASLIVMVMISGYENFVSRIEAAGNDDRLAWVGKLDAGTLKLKVSSSIVAISSIHLLKSFMNIANIDNTKLLWLVVIHLTFVVSAVMMAVMEKKIMHDSDEGPG
jgi:uncharacterized protein (TIGR00645 family)